MAYNYWPWLWPSGYDFDPPVPHMHRFRDPWTARGVRAPRWAFPSYSDGPCCEFCSTLGNIPGLDASLADLGQFPPIFHPVIQALNNIHYHYKLSLDSDGEEPFFLAREMESLSRYLRKLYQAYPHMIELALWADQLKYMGRDMQIGPRRLRYSPVTKHRHNRRLLLPQIAW
ncbi:hypothetical protein ACJQWK_09824 [Exserohilum turcicum]|uniref:Uncharacterized protein n=1 Tax=Exserohilum turcicum (strain 28A) TaxID=671987 RepID=R0JXQ8_EXST2|nr:uncharacterized protein SETTUDRAFT_24553 [Exserohilum turcica Et28A]EOA81042.1 hypothetical protein SETTUDRAFT_24553 [Exserohilum turcica Et28A]